MRIFIGNAIFDIWVSHQSILLLQSVVDTNIDNFIIFYSITQRMWNRIGVIRNLFNEMFILMRTIIANKQYLSVIIKQLHIIFSLCTFIKILNLRLAPVHANTSIYAIMTKMSFFIRWKWLCLNHFLFLIVTLSASTADICN